MRCIKELQQRRFSSNVKLHCRICNREFTAPTSLIVHYRSHAGKLALCYGPIPDGLQCHSDKVAKIRDIQSLGWFLLHRMVASNCLWADYKNHAFFSGIKPFTCPICLTSFTRRHSLKYHMLCHSGQARFKCNICERLFRHSGHYKVRYGYFNDFGRLFYSILSGPYEKTWKWNAVHMQFL